MKPETFKKVSGFFLVRGIGSIARLARGNLTDLLLGERMRSEGLSRFLASFWPAQASSAEHLEAHQVETSRCKDGEGLISGLQVRRKVGFKLLEVLRNLQCLVHSCWNAEEGQGFRA